MELFKKITDGFLHESFAPCGLLMLCSRAMYRGHSIGTQGTIPPDCGQLLMILADCRYWSEIVRTFCIDNHHPQVTTKIYTEMRRQISVVEATDITHSRLTISNSWNAIMVSAQIANGWLCHKNAAEKGKKHDRSVKQWTRTMRKNRVRMNQTLSLLMCARRFRLQPFYRQTQTNSRLLFPNMEKDSSSPPPPHTHEKCGAMRLLSGTFFQHADASWVIHESRIRRVLLVVSPSARKRMSKRSFDNNASEAL
jgi:hypothetical protein